MPANAPPDALPCPACKGTGEYGETRYQPVEGMAYMDAPRVCPFCTPPLSRADYPSGPKPRGWLTQEDYENACDELDLCHGCGYEDDRMPEPGFSLCGPCSADAAADEAYHMAVDDGLA